MGQTTQQNLKWVIFEEFQQNRELVLGILSILEKQAFWDFRSYP